MHASSSGSTIGIRDRRIPAGPAVKQLMYVFSKSIWLATDAGMKSAKPMPNTLPALMSVMPSSTIADTIGRLGVGETVHPEAAGDVRIERGAGDVLAAALDDQHVDLLERQRRHERPGVFGELVLAVAADLVGRQGVDAHDVAAARLDRPDAAEETPRRLERGDAVEQTVAHLDRTARVDLRRTRLLAEADDGHLRAAATRSGP